MSTAPQAFSQYVDDERFNILSNVVSLDRSTFRRMQIDYSASENGVSSGATGNLLGSGQQTKFSINFPSNTLLNWNNSCLRLKLQFKKPAGTAMTVYEQTIDPFLVGRLIDNLTVYLNRDETNPLVQTNQQFYSVFLARCLVSHTRSELENADDYLFTPVWDCAYEAGQPAANWADDGGRVVANCVYQATGKNGQLTHALAAGVIQEQFPGGFTGIPLEVGAGDLATTQARFNEHCHRTPIETAALRRMQKYFHAASDTVTHLLNIPLPLLSGFKCPDDCMMSNLKKLGINIGWNSSSDLLHLINNGLATADQGRVFVSSAEFCADYYVLSQTQSALITDMRVKNIADNLCWIDCQNAFDRATASQTDEVFNNISDLIAVMAYHPSGNTDNGQHGNAGADIVNYRSYSQFDFGNLAAEAGLQITKQINAAANTRPSAIQMWYGFSYPEKPLSCSEDLTTLYTEAKKAATVCGFGKFALNYTDFCNCNPLIFFSPIGDRPKPHSPNDLIVNITSSQFTPLSNMKYCIFKLNAMKLMADGSVVKPPMS
jgi:hypothetical protein